MSQLVLIIIAVVVVLVIVALYMGSKESKQAGISAGRMIKRIDQIYSEFVSKKINLNIIKTDSVEFDIEILLKEVLTILKPEIDGLIAHINTTIYQTVEVKCDSERFSNVCSVISSMYRKSRQYESKELTEEDEKEFVTVFEDAIRADLQKRKLDFETGLI